MRLVARAPDENPAFRRICFSGRLAPGYTLPDTPAMLVQPDSPVMHTTAAAISRQSIKPISLCAQAYGAHRLI